MPTVNRFDQPTQVNYVSQYVPIPFDQLYQLGREYNARVDRAIDQFNTQLNTWSQFKSPSAVDTQRFYDRTIGAAQPIVEEMVNNPDLLRTAEGRSRIQSFINNRPYDELSQLQQNRENMLQRQQLEQQLSIRGLWNPLWHSFDYTNYDTLGDEQNRAMGLLSSNDMTLLPYKSTVDLVAPFVDNLKPSFIGTDGVYNVSGVSEQRTREQVDAHMSEILSTPYAQRHIQVLQNQFGLSQDDAVRQFVTNAYTAAKEYAYRDYEINPLALLAAKQRMSIEEGVPQQELPSDTPRNMFDKSVLAQNVNNMNNQFSKLPDAKQNQEAVQQNIGQRRMLINWISQFSGVDLNKLTPMQQQMLNENTALLNQKQQEYTGLVTDQIRQDFNNKYGNETPIDFDDFNPDVIDPEKFGKVSRDILESYGANNPNAQEIVRIQYGQGPADQKKGVDVQTINGEREGFVINSREILLPQQLAAGMLQIQNPQLNLPQMSYGVTLGDINTWMGIGAGAGAVAGGYAGTAVFPGVGTAAGTGLGAISGGIAGLASGLIGAFFGPGESDIYPSFVNGDMGDVTVVVGNNSKTISTESIVDAYGNGQPIQYVQGTAIIPFNKLDQIGIGTSLYNTRNDRMKKQMNAAVNDELETYEIPVYIPLYNNQDVSKQYDRNMSNYWYGTTSKDADRYNEDLVNAQRNLPLNNANSQ